MKKKRIDLVVISPLLLLVLLPLTAFISPLFTKTAAHPDVAFLKYFVVPLIGFSLGSIVFLGIVRNDWKMSGRWMSFVDGHLGKIVLTISVIFLICYSALAVLRYTSLHTTVFDMGAYDHKIWSISVASGMSILYESTIGHFQPILIPYGLLYRIHDSPVIIQIIQTIVTISGVTPIYLMSKRYLENKSIILLIAIAYILYPHVGFIASLEFHPDHLYVPLVLWAFYFAEKENYITAIIVVGLGAMAKEPLILGASFFGLYLVFAKRQYRIGLATSAFFLILFFIVVYIILPYTNKAPVFQGGAFPMLEGNTENVGGIARMKSLINTVLMWKVRKVLFIYFLLAPLLFLPLLDLRRFLPAFPLVFIPLVSTTYFHSGVDSQYTAGIIGPAFMALIFSVKRIKDSWNVKYANAIVLLMIVMTITFHVAHGASPISMSFWKSGWAEMWHKHNYSSNEHEKVIKEAIYRVPGDRNITVVSQGNINHARLAHRDIFALFHGSTVTSLHRWEGATADVDYLLFDLNRPHLVGDSVDEEVYMKELQRIKDNQSFKIDFEKDGVLLFKKVAKGPSG